MTAWPSEIDELGIGLQAAIARHEQRSWPWRARRHWTLLIPAVLLVAVLALASLSAWQRGGNGRDHGAGGSMTTHVLPPAPLRAIGAHGGPVWGVKLAVTGSLACHGVWQLLRGRVRIGAAPARSFNARSAAMSPIPHCAFSSR